MKEQGRCCGGGGSVEGAAKGCIDRVGLSLAISDSRISAQGLMSRASKPGSESDTRAGMMHRSNIHASPRRRRRRSLVHSGAALNIEEGARSRVAPAGAADSVLSTVSGPQVQLRTPIL